MNSEERKSQEHYKENSLTKYGDIMQAMNLKKVFVLIFALYICAFINRYDIDIQVELFNKWATNASSNSLESKLGLEVSNVYSKSKLPGYDGPRIRINRVKSDCLWLDFYTLYYENEKYPTDSISVRKEIILKKTPILGFEIIEEFWI